MSEQIIEGKRWSGADWASEKETILLIGAGGIGSFTAFSLARIGHNLVIFDGDYVDGTNISGGQMFMSAHLGQCKVDAVLDVCRKFGCGDSQIDVFNEDYNPEVGMSNFCICAVDNMKSRREIFEAWIEHMKNDNQKGLFIDGRLTLEMSEIFAIQSDRQDQIEEYKLKHLFSDEESQILDCTTKQSTFGAMLISSLITSTLCNYLTNRKLDVDFREIPFYNRMYLPIFQQELRDVTKQEAIIETEIIKKELVKE
jgi:hypothetical protein